ncbi:ABC transporter permease [Halobacterium sp. KA-4]|uniref:ABC transporter permease n=1 Tax=Halobacterium sp. KA-4 TaxID=2896367 RepID=UPI001E408AFD|nr:ABC transporter permease subunit [Halobacterium sp. KA-4]
MPGQSVGTETVESPRLRQRLRSLELALPFALSLPLAALYLLFLGLPIATVVQLSLQGETPWSNYVTVFTESAYRNSILTSLQIAVTVTVITTVLGLIVAYFLAKNEFRGKRIVISIINFPTSLPGILIAWGIIVLVGRQGVFSLLGSAITGARSGAFAFALGYWGLLLGYTYFTLPRVTMTLLSSLENINPELEETAYNLGANRLQTFRYVVLPEIMPGIASGVVLAFSINMVAFGTALLLAAGKVSVLPLQIYSVVLGFGDYNLASAMAIVLTVITLGVIMSYGYVFGGSIYE